MNVKDPPARRERRAAALLGLLIAAAVLALYGRTAGFDYVFDDEKYIVANPNLVAGLTWEGVRWAFTSFYHANWHPVSWISHLADRTFFGASAGPAHLVNAALHTACGLLLFLLLRRMTGALLPSAFAAAAFALHPLRVESVAWVTERKDPLSTIFWLLALGAHLRYARRPGAGPYALLFLFFSLGLMTKPMGVTLPFALLLLDWWPLGRLRSQEAGGVSLRRLLVEKVPLLVLSCAAAAVAFASQRSGGAMASLERVPLGERIPNAVVAYVTYLADTFWPSNLAVFYPHPGGSLPPGRVLGAGLLLAAVSALALGMSRRIPALVCGWLWYLGTLVPVIGLVQVGDQGHADRYSYLPSIGLLIALVWASGRFLKRLPGGPALPAALALAALAALATASWHQIGFWRDDVTLFTRARAVAPGSWLVESNLGPALAHRGDLEGALPHFREAIRIRPREQDAHYRLAAALAKLGRPDEAVEEYRLALRYKPDFSRARFNLAVLLESLGRSDEAEAQYAEALRLQPDFIEARLNYGALLTARGRRREAIAHYREALRVRADQPVLRMNLANALDLEGQREEALIQYGEALRLAPADPRVRVNAGLAFERAGRREEAFAQFREALRLEPDNPRVRLEYALALERAGRPAEARAAFAETLRLQPGNAEARAGLERSSR